MLNAPSARDALPSLTLTTMLPQAPTCCVPGRAGQRTVRAVEARPGRQVRDAERQCIAFGVSRARLESIAAPDIHRRRRAAGDRWCGVLRRRCRCGHYFGLRRGRRSDDDNDGRCSRRCAHLRRRLGRRRRGDRGRQCRSGGAGRGRYAGRCCPDSAGFGPDLVETARQSRGSGQHQQCTANLRDHPDSSPPDRPRAGSITAARLKLPVRRAAICLDHTTYEATQFTRGPPEFRNC